MELDAIPGTGKGGRVTKRDMMAHLSGRSNGAAAVAPAPQPAKVSVQAPKAPVSAPAVSMNGEDEIVEMDRMRKLIADHMVNSVQTSPHVTLSWRRM